MKVLLIQLDGKLPNIALMRLSAHHKALSNDVAFRHLANQKALDQMADDLFNPLSIYDQVYASAIFEKTAPLAEYLLSLRSDAVIGGTGVDKRGNLEDIGVTTKMQDYGIYPKFSASIGFTQRGCRFKCSHCVVPEKEGDVTEENTVTDIWRGGDHPKHLHLLDNDFFGQENWQARIDEIKEGGFKVCLNQGINARMLNDQTARALASVLYFDDQFRERRIYTAWDNCGDEKRLFAGLDALKRHGIKPEEMMVYMLIAYDHRKRVALPKLLESDFYRVQKLKDYGALPYPMPFIRTPETIGFQRWVISHHYKNISWQTWVDANYQPRNLYRGKIA